MGIKMSGAEGGCNRQITHAAAEVEYVPPQMRQSGQLEGIELEILIADLLLKLVVEEGNAAVGFHGGIVMPGTSICPAKKNRRTCRRFNLNPDALLEVLRVVAGGAAGVGIGDRHGCTRCDTLDALVVLARDIVDV